MGRFQTQIVGIRYYMYVPHVARLKMTLWTSPQAQCQMQMGGRLIGVGCMQPSFPTNAPVA
jgi:hypothetical protein